MQNVRSDRVVRLVPFQPGMEGVFIPLPPEKIEELIQKLFHLPSLPNATAPHENTIPDS